MATSYAIYCSRFIWLARANFAYFCGFPTIFNTEMSNQQGHLYRFNRTKHASNSATLPTVNQG